MRFNWFEHSSEGAKFVLSLAAMMGFMAMGIVLSALLAIPFFGISAITELGNQSSSNIDLLKFFQAFQSFFLFILPPLVLPILFGEQPTRYLKLSNRLSYSIVVLSIAVIFFALPGINYAQYINSRLDLPDFMSGIEQWMRSTEDSVNKLTESFLKTSSVGGLLVNILVMALIPAIGEELTFRGLFQHIFTRWFRNYHAGIWLSALLFSAFHFQFFGFVPRLMLGVIFGYIVAWTGNLSYAIIMHFTNNALGILFYYLVHNGMIPDKVDSVGVTGDYAILYLGVSIVFTGLLLYFVYRKHEPIST
ncbi:MAG: CPBP family intramembrane metalloprotease [Bacteroidales bacterium]|nr:CPBP family intramembrane metalloprotease [Bacteroidales bacterium]